MLLVVVGVLFAAGSHKVTSSFSGDVSLYEHYARAALSSPLFHSMPVEYPAAALAIYLVPLTLPVPYALGFALLAAIAGIALVLSSDGLPQYPGWSRRTCYYLVIGTGAVVFARYDVFPALAALLAVESARREKWDRAWVWAVVGGLLKFFPFLLLPGFFLIERAQTGKWAFRRVGATCVGVAILTTAQYSVDPKSLLSPLMYQVHRGFELSSLQGSASFILDPLHAYSIGAYSSIEVVGRGAMVISALTMVVTVLAMCSVWVLARRGLLSVVAVSLAILSLAVFSEKPRLSTSSGWHHFGRSGPSGKAGSSQHSSPPSCSLCFTSKRQGVPVLVSTCPAVVAVVRNIVLVVATVQWFHEQLRPQREGACNAPNEMRPDIIEDTLSVAGPGG